MFFKDESYVFDKMNSPHPPGIKLATSPKLIAAHADPGGLGARFGDDVFGDTEGKAVLDGSLRNVRIYTVPLQCEDVDYLYQIGNTDQGYRG